VTVPLRHLSLRQQNPSRALAFETVSGSCKHKFKIRHSRLNRRTKELHSFAADGKDGYHPYAGLVLDKIGNLYGTTSAGAGSGYGKVFKIGS
jgi:hypothetical protein